MRRPGLVVVALVLVVAGIAGIFALSQRGSVRSYLLSTYDVVSQEDDSYVLRSPGTVTATAADIRSAWKPAEEVVDPGGVFLR